MNSYYMPETMRYLRQKISKSSRSIFLTWKGKLLSTLVICLLSFFLSKFGYKDFVTLQLTLKKPDKHSDSHCPSLSTSCVAGSVQGAVSWVVLSSPFYRRGYGASQKLSNSFSFIFMIQTQEIWLQSPCP